MAAPWEQDLNRRKEVLDPGVPLRTERGLNFQSRELTSLNYFWVAACCHGPCILLTTSHSTSLLDGLLVN